MRYVNICWYIFALLLLAAPLSAQQTVQLPTQTVQFETPEVTVNMIWPEELPEGLADVLAAAYADAAQPGIQMLADQIARDREQEGAGTTERIITKGFVAGSSVLALVLLYKIWKREPNVTNINVTHEDGDIHVTVPPGHDDHHHGKGHHKDDKSEGDDR